MMLETTHDALQACAIEYRRRYLSTARRLLGDPEAAQDAVQDAMLSATRNLHRFRGESQLSTWLGRIVINSALSRRRVSRRRPEESLEPFLDDSVPRTQRGLRLISTGLNPERALSRRQTQSMIRAAVDELPREYRDVIVQWHFEDAPIPAIAERLGITANAVRIRLHRARRALHGLLAQRGYGPQ